MGLKTTEKLTLSFTSTGVNIIQVENDKGDIITFTTNLEDTKSTAVALRVVEEVIDTKLEELYNELEQLGVHLTT